MPNPRRLPPPPLELSVGEAAILCNCGAPYNGMRCIVVSPLAQRMASFEESSRRQIAATYIVTAPDGERLAPQPWQLRRPYPDHPVTTWREIERLTSWKHP